MPPGTLERTAPSLFKQGPTALTRWALYSALALFLMVADARFHLTNPLRQAVAALLYPVQWVMLQPVELAERGVSYFEPLQRAVQEAQQARQQLAELAQRANQTEYLQQENAQLRALLQLRARVAPTAQAAEVIYDAADPYTRRVVVDKGLLAGVQEGAPVLDEHGVLGQVTRVLPSVSEVTLLVDRDQAIPVLNPRSGARSVAYGNPGDGMGGGMELRFMHSNADVKEGDLLTTSGIDGVYPPGLPVARVRSIERRGDSVFTRIDCTPVAQVHGVRHVLLLQPGEPQLPGPPPPRAPSPPHLLLRIKKGDTGNDAAWPRVVAAGESGVHRLEFAGGVGTECLAFGAHSLGARHGAAVAGFLGGASASARGHGRSVCFGAVHGCAPVRAVGSTCPGLYLCDVGRPLDAPPFELAECVGAGVAHAALVCVCPRFAMVGANTFRWGVARLGVVVFPPP